MGKQAIKKEFTSQRKHLPGSSQQKQGSGLVFLANHRKQKQKICKEQKIQNNKKC